VKIPASLHRASRLFVCLLVSACTTRTTRYAAFEDLVTGSYTVNLYTNGECAVEMGVGFHAGHYSLRGDTILITYGEQPLLGVPTQLLLTPDFLLTLPTAEYPHSTKIHRQ
jgi:hypothetical protein